MPDKTIDDFTAVATPATTDTLLVTQSGTSKKETLAQIDTLLSATAKTLTNKTLTSPVVNAAISGTAIDTDGTLTANSDTLLASQKAVKTYTDTVAAAKVSDTAYAGSWNGVTTIAPSKNAVYDEMQLKFTTAFASAAEIQAGTEAAKAIAPDQLAASADAAAGVASIRTLGTGATQAMPGDTDLSSGRIQLFTADGTWTKPAGITTVMVKAVGGGGGGGGSGSTAGLGAGGGGGSGCYIEYICTVAGNITVTVGTGGAGGAAGVGSGAASSPGGASSFGTLAVAGGGIGGGTTSSSAGGSAASAGSASGTGTQILAIKAAGTNGCADGGSGLGGAGGANGGTAGASGEGAGLSLLAWSKGYGGKGGNEGGNAGQTGGAGFVLIMW